MDDASIKKTIHINPGLLLPSSSGSKKQPKKKHNKTRKSVVPTQLKKLFMDKINQHCNNKKSTHNVKPLEGDFDSHLEYLSSLSSKNKNVNIHTSLPDSLKPAPVSTPVPEPAPMSINPIKNISPLPVPPYTPLPVSLSTIKDVPYGNMKRGSKPTFRDWNNKTLNNVDSVSLNIPVEPIKDKTHKRKKKYTLGKRNNKVSVFIKNNKTRRKIRDEIKTLNSTNITDIKEYLRKHNMIKSGSNAPHDILRNLYKDIHLAGNVTNKSGDNMMHNYLKDK